MNFLLKRLFCLTVACLGFAPAFAEDFDHHVADIFILQAKPVQRELGVTEDQRARMNKAADADQQRKDAYAQELKKSKRKPDRARVLAMFRELRAEVFQQLAPSQMKRLRQISLQHFGPVALADPIVGKRVGLSTKQIEKIQAYVQKDAKDLSTTERDLRKSVVKRYKGKPVTEENDRKLGHDLNETIGPRVQNMEQKDRDQIFSVLTQAQRMTWNSLLGKPFEPKGN
jgi:hypothetical protein